MGKQFFKNLKQRIIDIGVAEVARRSGLARSVVHNFAHDRSSITSENMEKIIEALFCEVQVMLPDVKPILKLAKCDPKKVDQIAAIAKILKDLYSPSRIILFGSQATGNWNKESDADFLVIGFDPKVDTGQYQIDAFDAGIDVPFDVILATENRINEMKDVKSSVYSRALEEGVEIYAR